MDKKNEIIINPDMTTISNSVDQYSTGLMLYLDSMGLPKENVLVPVIERGKVIGNLPSVICLLDENKRQKSIYLSKFIAACGAGLFDAALNFVWDETIKSLREKVTRFDLDYFYSSVITDPDRRRKFTVAEDLDKLDDWELIRGCHLTGVLSDIGYKHLDYIRNMRNWASAAHPNQNELTGFQIISWLETCIKEVIGKEPAGQVVEVKRLLHNIRNQTLTPQDIAPISRSLEPLPHDLAISLLRTIFGMYTDMNLPATTKNNIKLVAGFVWNNNSEEAKQEIGLKYAIFAANADISRRDLAKEFLTIVNGLSYLPHDTLAVELDLKISNLYSAHIGYNNFHNEPSHAKALYSYVPKTGMIPDSVRYNYVKTLVMCHIGNGYGISHLAYQYYNELIDRFQDPEIWIIVNLTQDKEFTSRLQFPSCCRNFKQLIQKVKGKTSKQRVIDAINYLENRTEQQLSTVGSSTEMKRLLGIK